ncbi:MAG: GPR endopeptidase [Clostridium sp.]|nr:GPR endopeptidase [Clostridium sp.]
MKADIRTDLAMEARELHAAGTGVSEQNEQREGYAISRIRIETDETAKALGKAKGLYVTIDAPELNYGGAELTAAVTEAAANELSTMIAGLDGTAEKILVTRHIKQYMADAIPHHVRSVCAVSPGVLGVTGIETMEMIKGAASSSKPAVIIAIDSLASRRTERIGCTIQLCDAGLQPGAGVGNARSGLDRQSMGVPVIAIGVPLVVYASTISRDTVGLIAGELGLMNNEESVKELAAKAISEKTGELIVTPKEIDALIGSMSAILSNAINMALFGADHAELKSLIA